MSDYPQLNRVTTEYVPTEDRIRLSGETADDRTLVLWLTQRLLNLLVPQLTRWLEHHDAAASGADLFQEFAQQAAESSLTAEPAVQAAAPASAWCVITVDIATGPDGVTLIFKSDGETELAALPLNSMALRQWLAILRGQYLAGAWPTTVWPVWMNEGGPARAETPLNVLH